MSTDNPSAKPDTFTPDTFLPDDGDSSLGWNAVPEEPVLDPGLESFLDYSAQRRKQEQEQAEAAEAEAIALAKAAGERARAEAAEREVSAQTGVAADADPVAVPKKKKKKKKKKDGAGKKDGSGEKTKIGAGENPHKALAKVDVPSHGVTGKSEAELKQARKLIESDAPLAVIMSELDPELPVVSVGTKPLRTESRRRVIAVTLAVFTGFLGLHNFYLGHTKTAVLQLTLSVASMGLLAVISLLWAWYEAANFVLSSERKWRVDGLGIPMI